MTDTPADPRTDPPGNLGERETLEAFLDWYRLTVERKVLGLDREAATRRLVPSATNALGIVKHLAWVERGWFTVTVGGAPRGAVPWTEEDPDADFRIEADETVESVLEWYREQVAASRRVMAGVGSLDELRRRRHEELSVRWILVHMIEETARHAGHLDILRELTDGATGD